MYSRTKDLKLLDNVLTGCPFPSLKISPVGLQLPLTVCNRIYPMCHGTFKRFYFVESNWKLEMHEDLLGNSGMSFDPSFKRPRGGSISGRLRTASDLEESGVIDRTQKGLIKVRYKI